MYIHMSVYMKETYMYMVICKCTQPKQNRERYIYTNNTELHW